MDIKTKECVLKFEGRSNCRAAYRIAKDECEGFHLTKSL
jgi:hypothetical protein